MTTRNVLSAFMLKLPLPLDTQLLDLFGGQHLVNRHHLSKAMLSELTIFSLQLRPGLLQDLPILARPERLVKPSSRCLQLGPKSLMLLCEPLSNALHGYLLFGA